MPLTRWPTDPEPYPFCPFRQLILKDHWLHTMKTLILFSCGCYPPISYAPLALAAILVVSPHGKLQVCSFLEEQASRSVVCCYSGEVGHKPPSPNTSPHVCAAPACFVHSPQLLTHRDGRSSLTFFDLRGGGLFSLDGSCVCSPDKEKFSPDTTCVVRPFPSLH